MTPLSAARPDTWALAAVHEPQPCAVNNSTTTGGLGVMAGLTGLASAALARAARPAIESTKAPRLIAPVLVAVFLSRGSLSRERLCGRPRPPSEAVRVSVSLGQVAQHKVEHAALVEVLQLGRRIDPAAD